MPYLLTAGPRYPYGPAARFLLTGIQPPATGYLGPSDQLSVSVLSPNFAISFDLALRYLDLNGNVQPLLTKIQANATGATPFVMPIQLAEGFLLSAVAFGATVLRGQCWVQFVILRQKSDSTVVVADVLLQGYVSQTDYVAWPGTPVDSSIAGRGATRHIVVPAPGVGNDVVLTVPPATRWYLKMVRAVIDTPTDNIQPYMQIEDGAVLIASLPSSSNVQAPGVDTITWHNSNSTSPFGAFLDIGAVPVEGYLRPGWKIRLTNETAPFPGAPSTSAFWTAATFTFEEWVEL